MREIHKVIVDKISLITKEFKPAVPKAETSFGIFKIFKNEKQFEKLNEIENLIHKSELGEKK